jgi:hypothetical protein
MGYHDFDDALVPGRPVVAVGLFEGGGLVAGHFELERGDGFGQVMGSDPAAYPGSITEASQVIQVLPTGSPRSPGLHDIVFPKSVTPDRIRENIDIFDFELSATDVEDITVLNKNERTGPDPDKFDGR